MNAETLKVELELPKSWVDFIDLLCTLGGRTREAWLRETIRADLNAALDSPLEGDWDRDYLKARYGLDNE
jgi:hypothetical protein